MKRAELHFVLSIVMICVFSSARLFAQDPQIVNPDTSGIGDDAAKTINEVLHNIPDVMAAMLAKIEKISGNTLEEKSKYAMTQMMCIKGNMNHKFDTLRALMDMAKKSKELPKDKNLEKKFEIVKKYWPWLVRPLAGADGVFNQGDTKAVLSCLSQAELDDFAQNIIQTEIYGIVDEQVARFNHIPIIRRIAWRKGSQAKVTIQSTFQQKKYEFRDKGEAMAKAEVDKALREVFKVTEPVLEERACLRGEENQARKISVPQAIKFMREMTGHDAYALARQKVRSEFYKTHMDMPKMEMPKSIAAENLGVEFEFPKGIPLNIMEEFLLKDTLPTKFILGMREEVRNGKKVKVFSIEPQKLGLGVNLRQVEYDSEKGGKVKYVTVTQVLPDSPAARAGLKVGDLIRSMNGKDMANEPVDQVILGIEQAARSRNRNLDFEVVKLSADGKSRYTESTPIKLDHPCPESQVLPDDLRLDSVPATLATPGLPLENAAH